MGEGVAATTQLSPGSTYKHEQSRDFDNDLNILINTF